MKNQQHEFDSNFATQQTSIPTGSAFKFFISVDATGIALANAAGFGKTAIGLAKHYASVICLCETLDQAFVIRNRLKAMQVDNVYLVVGEYSRLPFAPDSFSNISFHEIDIGLVTRSLTAFIHRSLNLLRMDGDMYFSCAVSTQNYLTKLKLAIMTILATSFGRLLIRSRIHHYPSLEQVNFVRSVASITVQDLLFEFKRLIKGNNLGFVIGKQKEQKPPLIKVIQDSIEQKMGLQLRPSHIVLVGSHASIISDLGKAIVRLPQSAAAIRSCGRNFENLHLLNKKKLPFATPQPLTHDKAEGQTYFAESKLPGTSLDMHVMNNRDFQHYREQGAKLLIDPRMSNGDQTIGSFIGKYCIHDCEELKQHLDSKQNEILEVTIKTLTQVSSHLKIPKIVQHGDFKYSNFLSCGTKAKLITGVIDWDMGIVEGLPLADILTVSIYEYETTPQDFAVTLFHLVNGTFPNITVKNYCAELKIELQVFNLLCFLVGLRYLTNAFATHVKNQESWRRDLIANALIPACNLLLSRYQTQR